MNTSEKKIYFQDFKITRKSEILKFLFQIMLSIAVWMILTISCQLGENPVDIVIITGNIEKGFQGNLPSDAGISKGLRIQYSPFQYIGAVPPNNVIQDDVEAGRKRWEIIAHQALLLSINPDITFIVHPGDSININYRKDKIVCSGNRADTVKFALINKLADINRLYKQPLPNSFAVNSVEDYFKWIEYVDSKLAIQMKIIDSCQKKISAVEFQYFKAQIINKSEGERINAFGALRRVSIKDTLSGPCQIDLVTIWDTTQHSPWGKWLRSLSTYYGPINIIHLRNRFEVWRKFNFDFNNKDLSSKDSRSYLYYEFTKEKYTGLLRERLLAYILDEEIINEMEIKNSITQEILKDYYSQPGFPEYKLWVKEIEDKARRLARN